MNNQQFIFYVFGSIAIVGFTAIGLLMRLERKLLDAEKGPTAEPESPPRSAE